MRVQGKALLVLPENNPEKSEGGIQIPATVKEKPNIGCVIEAGAGCVDAKIGDRIQYHRKGSSVITIDEVEHHFIDENQITYIYE